jgi:hypothetical protein
MAGAFSIHGFNEQIFGADEQVPKGGCGRCPKNTLWTRKLRKGHSDLCWWWPVSLVATAAEDRLSLPAATAEHLF